MKSAISISEAVVRHTSGADIPDVLALYEGARRTMRENGNPAQWPGAYPGEESLRKDMEAGVSYVISDGGLVCGTFALIPGIEPTYKEIYGGRWPDDSLPYCTIHRLAGARDRRGTAGICLGWCKLQCSSLRADTHKDNLIMQHILESSGFLRCGTILLADGSPRMAYQWLRDRK